MLPLYDKREGRKRGERIWLDREYEILSEEGRGGSSIVYRAFYEDSLKEKVEQKHIVLIKELYPMTADVSVFRRENGFISWEDDKERLFHAERFFQGNKVNLELLKEHPSLITGNLNSCEAYGTFYSVLPFYGGSTLEEYMKQEPVLSLRECSGIIKEILESLKPFHEKGLLHLDISPDNILLFHGQAVLIDFNCACSMDHLQENPYILGRKEGYTAPEIYIGEMGLIGFSADIYSICAVFFKLLTGKEPIDDLMEEPLSAAGIWKRLKREIPAFQKSSETAVSKTVEILLKGLDLNPLGRYQNISQLEKEIDELLVRIDHKGISHSVLWELGKRAWQQIPSGDQEYIPQEISVEGQENSSLKEFGGQLEEKRKILLRGTGGMGKTRLMKELARESMGRYDPKKPVYFYISLRGYQNWDREGRYIQEQIMKNLAFHSETDSLEDMFHQLELLFQQREGGKATIVLLLDGLNEAGENRKKLFEEIEELGKQKGVSVFLTDRTDEVLEYALAGFQKAELQPIPLKTVEKILEDRKVEKPGSQKVWELLRVPMMLELYIKNMALEKDNGKERTDGPKRIQTSVELVQIYLDNQLTARKRLHSNKVMQLRDTYILTHFLPSIAWEMDERRKTLLNEMEMAQAARQSFWKLLSDNFKEKFPEYRGYTDEILFNRNEDKWYGYAVGHLLCQETGLLTRTGDDDYQLSHDNFRSYLLWQAMVNEEQITKKRIYIHELETDREMIEYGTLNMIRAKLDREYKEMGKEMFLGTYQTRFSFFAQLWRSIDLRYLLALLESLNPDFPYNGQVHVGKPIVLDDKILEKILEGDQELLDKVVLRTPGAYLKYGLLL